MSVPPQKGLSFAEFLQLAELIWVQKDRIATALAETNERVPIAPYVQPIVAMDLNRVLRPLLVDSSGRLTEASAANIRGDTLTIAGYALLNTRPTVGPTPQGANPRIGRAVAAVVAGAFSNLSLVPALANYYGVVKIIGVLTDDAAVGATLTFESPAATPALPSVLAGTYVANVVNKGLEGVVVTHVTLADNQAIVVDGLGFGGAATFCIVLYKYWYET